MFLAVFSLIENKSLQIKTKNREVLSASIRFETKNIFEFYFFRKSL